MAEKKETVTYFSLRNEVINHKFHPIYVLQGEEPYYIDQLSQLIVDNALTEDERDFNLSIFYGNNASILEVINSCKQYPVFAEHKVVVLREAQLVKSQSGHSKDLDLLKHYAERPLESTILVVCAKGGDLGSKPFTDQLRASRSGVIFTSAKVREGSRDLLNLITGYANSIGCNIDAKSASMLSESIGNNIARLFGEIDKLKIIVGDNGDTITPELIEKNIGISKDYNIFELEDALSTRNAVKAFRIIDYFKRNPKANSLPPILANLFGYFSNVLIVSVNQRMPQPELMNAVGTKSVFRLKKFQDAARNYSTASLINVIHLLRATDVKSKGIGSRQDPYALLTELTYKILHC